MDDLFSAGTRWALRAECSRSVPECTESNPLLGHGHRARRIGHFARGNACSHRLRDTGDVSAAMAELPIERPPAGDDARLEDSHDFAEPLVAKPPSSGAVRAAPELAMRVRPRSARRGTLRMAPRLRHVFQELSMRNATGPQDGSRIQRT